MTPLNVFIGAVIVLMLLLLAGCVPCQDYQVAGCPSFPNAAPRP